jgi:hypothetical protein
VFWLKDHVPPKEVLNMLSSNVKYIGLDVHKEAITVAVRNGAGKLVVESIVETKASTLLDFLHGLRGELHVTLEEGTWAAWLYDVLKPHVREIVVCNPRRNALLKEGSKNDKVDARKLSELLRAGLLRAVYHGEHGLRTLRELARSYEVVSKDLKRVMNRLKALYRGWGIPCTGTQVYSRRHREQWLQKIKEARSTPPRRTVLSAAGWIAGLAAHRARRTVSREPPTSGSESSATDSFHRPASGRAAGRPYADTAPVPEQAAAVDLQRPGSRDTRQRAISLRGRTTATLEEATAGSRTQSQSQPRDEGDLQECGPERHSSCRTIPGFL